MKFIDLFENKYKSRKNTLGIEVIKNIILHIYKIRLISWLFKKIYFWKNPVDFLY